MSEHSKPVVQPPSPRVSSRFGQALRRYFVAGLATLFPVAVTLWLLFKIFMIADGLLGRHFKIPGLGLLVTICVILMVGVFSVHFFGHVVFRTFEILFNRLPIVKKIYPPIKQLTSFIFNEKARESTFSRVVLVQYPRNGVYSIAFVTKEWDTTVTGQSERFFTLLVPTPPSPFTGPIVFTPISEVIPLTMTVEEALKLIMSGGIAASPLQRVISSN